MPIWAACWRGRSWASARLPRGLAALALGVCGIAVLLGARVDGGPALGPEKLPGVLLALGAAVLFALGAVTARRSPLALPPLAAVAWQVGLGCLPMVVAGLLFERRTRTP